MRVIYISPPNEEDSSGAVTDAMVTIAIEYLTRHGYSNTVQALQAAGNTLVHYIQLISIGYNVSTAEDNYLEHMSRIIQVNYIFRYAQCVVSIIHIPDISVFMLLNFVLGPKTARLRICSSLD